MPDQNEIESKANKIMVAVTVLRVDGGSTLVEFVQDGEAFRKMVPSNKLTPDNEIDDKSLSRGVSYGIAWAEELDKLSLPQIVTSTEVEKALHNAGVWDQDDVWTNPGAVIGALQSLYAVDLGVIAQIAGKG